MRLDKARLRPTTESEWDGDAKAIIDSVASGSRAGLNLLTTVARRPRLLTRWMAFGSQILFRSTLSDRERELAILRTGWNAASGYEWTQHVALARSAGCTDDEIARVTVGPADPGWSERDRAILAATDELMADYFVSDPTWSRLREHLDEEQCIDLVFAVGQYVLVSMALNTFGVQLEDGVERPADWPTRG